MVITETKTYPTPVGRGSSTEAYLMSIDAPEWILKAVTGKIKVVSSCNTSHIPTNWLGEYKFELVSDALKEEPLPACYDYSDKPMD